MDEVTREWNHISFSADALAKALLRMADDACMFLERLDKIPRQGGYLRRREYIVSEARADSLQRAIAYVLQADPDSAVVADVMRTAATERERRPRDRREAVVSTMRTALEVALEAAQKYDDGDRDTIGTYREERMKRVLAALAAAGYLHEAGAP